METLDLTKLPEGKTYEDTYGGWLSIFERVAISTTEIWVLQAPISWMPLLVYLGARVESTRVHFKEDHFLDLSSLSSAYYAMPGRFRELVEATCSLRPELVDALWKSDMEWSCPHRKHPVMQKEFVVANYSAFWRPEIKEYMEHLWEYAPVKRSCVLVPCAADKPYPSPLHRRVKEIVGEGCELIVATGVLGLVPEGLWGIAPSYDCGLPNEWRVMETVLNLFEKWDRRYERILVYSDFYADAIAHAFDLLARRGVECARPEFVCSRTKPPVGYLPLMDPVWLDRLRVAVEGESSR